MDPALRAEIEYRIQHRHADGTWGDMHPVAAHSPADRDPERGWGFRRIYKCASCDEQITIGSDDDPLVQEPVG
jgi:hypothetical protein